VLDYNRCRQLSTSGPISELLARARRRRLFQLVCEESLTAVILALVGIVALLIAGTAILDWYWPVAMFVIGLAVGGYRLRKRIAGNYRLLQVVDRRLGLADVLSTAYFFSADPTPFGVSDGVRDKQRESAEQHCRNADVRLALPFAFPKRAYAAAAVALVAVSMFGLRYGLLRTLDLAPPIAQSLFEFDRPTTAANMAEPVVPPSDFDTPEGSVDGDEQARSEGDDMPLSEMPGNLDPMPPGMDGLTSGDELYDPISDSEGNNPEWGEGFDSDQQEGQADEAGNQPGENADDQGMPDFPPPDDPDLFQQLQDAFANLMSRLQAPEPTGNRLVPDPEGDQQQEGEGDNNNSQQQRFASSSQPGNTPVPSEGFEERDPMDEAEITNADIPGDAQSIAGTGEGNKEIRLAEQLEAMGKLSEIIGQRSENLTGEMMVESSSGDQSLETAYTESDASHRSAGGSIHRDQVPLELRDYVQAYFEEVRRQPEPTQEQ